MTEEKKTPEEAIEKIQRESDAVDDLRRFLDEDLLTGERYWKTKWALEDALRNATPFLDELEVERLRKHIQPWRNQPRPGSYISSDFFDKDSESLRDLTQKILRSLGGATRWLPRQENTSTPTPPIPAPTETSGSFDVFICHASEDKEFVGRLASELSAAGVRTWYDGFRIDWGDDLRHAIDNGLLESRYGLVVLSESFLQKKKWTEYELNGLFGKERESEKVVLPIWHGVERADILQYSPTLADRIALKSEDIGNIVTNLKELLGTNS